MSSFDKKRKAVDTKIGKLEVQGEEIDGKIGQVEEKIEQVERDISKVTDGSKIEEQLRNEKSQLRNKKAQLRNEKAQLRDKEAQLRNEKAQLFSEQFGAMKILHTGKGGMLSTPTNQGSASSFANAKIKVVARGFGGLLTCCRVDPTSDQRISRRLIPSAPEVAEETLGLACMGEKATLAARGKDETFGVRSMLDDIAINFPPLVSSGSRLQSYKIIGEGIPTTPFSAPDFVWMVQGRIVGILEVKDGTSSTLVALRQAAITATALVTDLRSRGVPPEQIVLPVAGCTGAAMQFGAIICLEPSFGTFIATSTILDLSDATQNRLAAAYLRKAGSCARETERLLAITAPTPTPSPIFWTMDLDTSAYWTKSLTDDVFSVGLGLFTTTSASRFDVGPGLSHMGLALTLLYQHEAAREIVAFPLSVRSPNCLEENAQAEADADDSCYMIIYDDLSKLGYSMGTPDRLEDEDLYQRYLVSLKLAVKAVHGAGVLHCDLYPSNIMWRSDCGADGTTKVCIKIVDWDCAHCLAEGAFSPRVAEALRQHEPTRSANFDTRHDLRYLHALEGAVDVSDTQGRLRWKALASNVKQQVDDAFFCIFASADDHY